MKKLESKGLICYPMEKKIKKALEKSYILLKENDESRISIADSLMYVIRELKSIEAHHEEVKMYSGIL